MSNPTQSHLMLIDDPPWEGSSKDYQDYIDRVRSLPNGGKIAQEQISQAQRLMAEAQRRETSPASPC